MVIETKLKFSEFPIIKVRYIRRSLISMLSGSFRRQQTEPKYTILKLESTTSFDQQKCLFFFFSFPYLT